MSDLGSRPRESFNFFEGASWELKLKESIMSQNLRHFFFLYKTCFMLAMPIILIHTDLISTKNFMEKYMLMTYLECVSRGKTL